MEQEYVMEQEYMNWKFQFLNVMGDHEPSANISIDMETECKISIAEDEGEDHYQYFDGRRIHRVPQLMRFKKKNEGDYYTPKMVSFGPYWHGKLKPDMAEKLKHEVLTLFVSSSGKARKFFYCQIFKVVDQIRNCYVGVSKDAYDDGALAEMMLLDGCFAIYLMEISLGDEEKYSHFCKHFGRGLLSFAYQDFHLLENQIPLWVIKILIKIIYSNKEEGEMLLYKFLSKMALGGSTLKRIPGEDKKQPLHILDAFHRILVRELNNEEEEEEEEPFHRELILEIAVEDNKEEEEEFVQELDNEEEEEEEEELVQDLDNTSEELVEELDNYAGSKMPFNKCLRRPLRTQNPNQFEEHNRQFRSVTDLKAKGIKFKPSNSYCLRNIKFKSYPFWGQLQLPVYIFTTRSKRFLTNMIAYEVSPESETNMTMICYVNFLKSLIVKPEDVKELREQKILFSTLDSDERVMEVIKDIDTRGLGVDSYFDDVKKRIEEHCRSLAKTWIAELIHTYLRSPLTFIGLLAATFLLCLNFATFLHNESK